MTSRHLFLPLFAILLMQSIGCAAVIPNTNVEDTPENRDVISFLEEYRQAVAQRNVRRLLDLASPMYLDDNGTPNTDDDLDYDALRDRLAVFRDRLLDVRYEMKYHRITWEESRVYVEVRYTGQFQTGVEGGETQWSRRLRDHRLVLSRDEDGYHILSGM